MNREIKCRGKRIDNGEWVFGDLIKLRTKIELDVRYIHSGMNQPVTNDFWEDFHEVIPETVGQFTGLYDRDGKEIYEGDVFQKIVYPNIYTRTIGKDGTYNGETKQQHSGVLIRSRVVWDRENCCFYMETIYVNPAGVKTGSTLVPQNEIAIGDKYPVDFHIREDKKSRVITNIHDNPELLKNNLYKNKLKKNDNNN